MPGTIFRRATEFDFDTIVFNNIELVRETEGIDLDKSIVIKGAKSALCDSNKGFYLIAEVDDQPAGQLMITREWSDWRYKTFRWIQSLPEYRRSGIFSGLY
ncbi:MAG: GNAT family N-acetyltransferase [Candidatus Marinimicrobia bacterium]|nr:GNAT family N-acetyltransferase [Candidatus Neomarinimicrobiota bacterium]